MNQVRHPLTQHFQSENAAQLMDTSDLSEWPMANWSLGHLLGILVEYTPEWQPAGTSASELVERNYSRGSVEMKMIFIYIYCAAWGAALLATAAAHFSPPIAICVMLLLAGVSDSI